MRLNLMDQQPELEAHVEIIRRAYPQYEIADHVAILPLDATVPTGVYGVYVAVRHRERGWYGWLSVEPDGTAVELDSEGIAPEHMFDHTS